MFQSLGLKNAAYELRDRPPSEKVMAIWIFLGYNLNPSRGAGWSGEIT